MRYANTLVFCIAIAVLFVFVGMPEKHATKAQDKPAVAEIVPAERDVNPEPTPATPAPACKCDCDCGPKLADLQSQINAIKSELGELACRCNPKAEPQPMAPAPQAAAPKPNPAPKAPVDNKAQYSGGSWMGPGDYSYHRDDDGRLWLKKTAPAAPDANGCYVDANGRKVCPLLQQRQQAVQANSYGIPLAPGETLLEVDGVPVGNRSRVVPPMFPNLKRK